MKQSVFVQKCSYQLFILAGKEQTSMVKLGTFGKWRTCNGNNGVMKTSCLFYLGIRRRLFHILRQMAAVLHTIFSKFISLYKIVLIWFSVYFNFFQVSNQEQPRIGSDNNLSPNRLESTIRTIAECWLMILPRFYNTKTSRQEHSAFE